MNNLDNEHKRLKNEFFLNLEKKKLEPNTSEILYFIIYTYD